MTGVDINLAVVIKLYFHFVMFILSLLVLILSLIHRDKLVSLTISFFIY